MWELRLGSASWINTDIREAGRYSLLWQLLYETDRLNIRQYPVFSRHCKSYGYQEGRPGRFKEPLYAVMDQRYKNQLLVTDYSNKAVRTVDVVSPIVGRFEKSNWLKYIKSITQDQKSGEVYATVPQAVYRITYIQRTVTLILGSPDSFSYKDSTLLDSLFDWPYELIFITPHTLLVADKDNKKLRLVDMNSDKVRTLNVRNSLNNPICIIPIYYSLYVGQYQKIIQYKCKCSIITIHLQWMEFHTRQHVQHNVNFVI